MLVDGYFNPASVPENTYDPLAVTFNVNSGVRWTLSGNSWLDLNSYQCFFFSPNHCVVIMNVLSGVWSIRISRLPVRFNDDSLSEQNESFKWERLSEQRAEECRATEWNRGKKPWVRPSQRWQLICWVSTFFFFNFPFPFSCLLLRVREREEFTPLWNSWVGTAQPSDRPKKLTVLLWVPIKEEYSAGITLSDPA